MTHLRQLNKVNQAYAIFNVVVGLVCAVGMGWMTIISYEADLLFGHIMLGSTILTVGLVGVFAALMLMTGTRVEQGRWRLMQTILAVLNISNVPMGTAYGAYALWVCWSDPASKARFEDAPPPEGATTDTGTNRFYKIVMWLIYGFGAFVVLLTVGTFVGVGVMMQKGGQEPEVTVTAETIEISGMYGETIRRDEIQALELHDELPTITLRTNGYAMGNDLKGWFATEELDRVKLFVHADQAPFLYIQTADHWTIFGYDDAEQTEALFLELGGPTSPM